MPELSEVEVFRKYAVRTSLNRKIGKVKLSCSAASLSQSLVKNKFTNAVRVGKYPLLGNNMNRRLVMHFELTGALHYQSSDDEPDFTRLNIYFKKPLFSLH